MDKICPICKKTFHVKPSRNKKQHCCSISCGRIMRSERWKKEGNPRWKGGVYLCGGRFWVKKEGHPRANIRGYISRSLLVAERKEGRNINKKEVIHHINGNPSDDRPENLMVITQSEHAFLHGVLLNPQVRESCRLRQLGVPLSNSHKQKISQALKGKSFSVSHKDKLKKAWKKRHEFSF